jgi:hypothetical protein
VNNNPSYERRYLCQRERAKLRINPPSQAILPPLSQASLSLLPPNPFQVDPSSLLTTPSPIEDGAGVPLAMTFFPRSRLGRGVWAIMEG